MSATPTVYFIDDSATMREVIKIAFRRENINVVACHDAATAISEIEQARPDVVITDVIMPGKDGYEVCQAIKQNSALAGTPVILMSGVVNRSVAEKAFAVKADELIRKPFQPQDLIARVRHLLKPEAAAPAPSAVAASAALSSIFGAAASAAPANGVVARRTPPPSSVPAAAPVPVAAAASPLVAAFAHAPAPAAAPRHPATAHTAAAAAPAASHVAAAAAAPAPAAPRAAGSPDIQKLKFEILRLESLVKKLQAELESERQYSRALEEHVKTLQESE
jgi:CheY-like chemotaxis protein